MMDPTINIMQKKKKSSWIIFLLVYVANSKILHCFVYFDMIQMLYIFENIYLNIYILELKSLEAASPCFHDYLSVPPPRDEKNTYILLLY